MHLTDWMGFVALVEKMRAAQNRSERFRTFFSPEERRVTMTHEAAVDQAIERLTAPPDEDTLAVERMIGEGAPDPDPLVSALAEVERLKGVVESLAQRCAGQSELLSAKAERKSP